MIDLACLFTALGMLRGPLSQRASSVRSNVPQVAQGFAQVNVAQRLPSGYTGIDARSRTLMSFETSRLTPVFKSIIRGYSSHTNMYLEDVALPESCDLTVKVFDPMLF
jgi:hypothetical protein